MHFKYEKIFLGPKQSLSLWPSADTIGCGLRPLIPEQHGPEGALLLKFFEKFLSPKMPLQNFS